MSYSRLTYFSHLAFINAMRNNSSRQEIERILTNGNINLNGLLLPNDYPPLVMATILGRIDVMALLLSKGANPYVLSDTKIVSQTSQVNTFDSLNLIPEEKKEEVEKLFTKYGYQKDVYAYGFELSRFHPRSENLLKVIHRLGYSEKELPGLCFGESSTARDYAARGKKGIGEFLKISSLLKRYDAETLLMKLKKAQNIQDEIIEKFKSQFRNEEREKIADTIIYCYKAYIKLDNHKLDTIVFNIIKAKFSDLTSEELNMLVTNIIDYKFLNKQLKQPVKDTINRIWTLIEDYVFECISDSYVQSRLYEEAKNKIEKEVGDPALLDLPSYASSVALSQAIIKHHHPIFPEKIRHLFSPVEDQNLLLTFPLISSLEAEKQGIYTESRVDSIGQYTKKQLEDFFTTWTQICKKELQFPIQFLLSSLDHAILAVYECETDEWTIFENSIKTTFQEDKYAEMAKYVFDAMAKTSNSIENLGNAIHHILKPKRLAEYVFMSSEIFVSFEDQNFLKNLNQTEIEKIHMSAEQNIDVYDAYLLEQMKYSNPNQELINELQNKKNQPAIFKSLLSKSVSISHTLWGVDNNKHQLSDIVLADLGQPISQEGKNHLNSNSSSSSNHSSRLFSDNGFFTIQHQNWLKLQKQWTFIWNNDHSLQTIQNDFLRNTTQPNDYRKHYQNIGSILNKKFELKEYENHLHLLTQEISSVLHSIEFKSLLPNATYLQIKEFENQVDEFKKTGIELNLKPSSTQ